MKTVIFGCIVCICFIFSGCSQSHHMHDGHKHAEQKKHVKCDWCNGKKTGCSSCKKNCQGECSGDSAKCASGSCGSSSCGGNDSAASSCESRSCSKDKPCSKCASKKCAAKKKSCSSCS